MSVEEKPIFGYKSPALRKKKKSGTNFVRSKTDSNKGKIIMPSSESSNSSAKEDSSSSEHGSNFSINKIKKMIDKKIQPGGDQIQNSQVKSN